MMIGEIIMFVLFCIVLFCGIRAEEIADSIVDLELSMERFNATIERMKEGNDGE